MVLSMKYLAGVFPNAKVILMVRDGRATVHSSMTRGVFTFGCRKGEYRRCLTIWNTDIAIMYEVGRFLTLIRDYKVLSSNLAVHVCR